MLLLHIRVLARYKYKPFQTLVQKRGMKAYIQIIGQNSPEGPPSLIVHYDQQRYLFNCREGTQRLCVQEKARLAKTSNVFLTRLSWETLGGLTGKNIILLLRRRRHTRGKKRL
jgi:ribonuclease Z